MLHFVNEGNGYGQPIPSYTRISDVTANSSHLGMISDGSLINGGFVQNERAEATGSLQKQLAERENEIKELLRANENWQKYNQQRDDYVMKLLQEIAAKGKEISGLKGHGALHELHHVNEEKLKELQRENSQLASSLVETEQKLLVSTQQNKDLKNQLENFSCLDNTLLQEQVRAYKEDFESERRDRERAQSRISDLENELSIVKRELKQYNLREMQNLRQRRETALEFHRKEYERKHPNSVYATDGHSPANDEEGEDEVDCI